MDQDAWLPWHTRQISELTQKGELTASTDRHQILRNGIDRDLDGKDNGWWAANGDWVSYKFDQPQRIKRVRLVFDSDFWAPRRMPCSYPLKKQRAVLPPRLVRDFDLQIRGSGSDWQTIVEIRNNRQRWVNIELDSATADEVRLRVRKTWGAEKAHLFAFDLI
jgi:hypothetical protein